MFQWKRSNFNGFPNVYIRFMAQDYETNEYVEFRVQDLPKDRVHDALEFMMRDQFLNEAPFMKGAGVKDDIVAYRELHCLMEEMIKQNVSLVCFKEGSDEIVGFNVLYVEESTNENHSTTFISEVTERLMAVRKFMFDKGKPFVPKNISFALKASGLSVDHRYRRRGIAVKLLEARIPLLKSIGLTTTITVFSGIGAQTAAKLAGYKEYTEITYDELSANGLQLKDIKEYSAKTMGYQIFE